MKRLHITDSAGCYKSDLTIVVNSCDAYADVLGCFFVAFEKFWPDCPYPLVVNTESKTNAQHSIQNQSGRNKPDDWGKRFLLTLNSISSKYVLVLCDDFILNAKVDNNRIEQAISFIEEKPKAVVSYLLNTSLELAEPQSEEAFIPLAKRAEYCLNSSPGIWRRESLINYTSKGDTPWAWEVFGTYRTFSDQNVFYSLNPKEEDIYPYDNSKGGAIYRGKWVKGVVDQMLKEHILEVDWNERGFSSDNFYEKRSLLWKIRFLRVGIKMVGLKSIYFVARYIGKKINAN